MKIENGFNECGTPVTYFACETCGNEFTVCPVVSDDRLDIWKNCLSIECGSYDPKRDVDKFFENPMISNLIARYPSGKDSL